MAEVHAAESTHWYSRSGEPAYEQTARNGTQRPTTLRDARTLLLVPSVTSIIRCAAAPGLEQWKQEQTLLAALTLPRGAEESEACWLDRIRNDSREQARLAAERGTAIHAAIEAWFGSQPFDPVLTDCCEAVAKAVEARYPVVGPWFTEGSFAHAIGFGGKLDLESSYGNGTILDFKTKDTVDDSTKGYDEHLMQLAAYRIGWDLPEATCANVFISRQEPWTVHIHEWSESDVQRGWRMFTALLDFWKARSGYDPAFTAEHEGEAA